MSEPMYNPELVMKVEDKLKELFVDLFDALQWKHLLPSRREELIKKYGLSEKRR